MSSGKYGAISGAVARMQMLNNISVHLAAAKTPGYKKGMVTFEAALGEAVSGMATKGTNFSHLTAPEIDFSPGHIEHSGDPLDLAINGDGFFQIQLSDGSLAFTRNGNFQLNSDGKLVDVNGNPVMGTGGELTLTSPDVDISSDGSIWSEGEKIGQIALYQFSDKKVLQRSGDDMFKAGDGTQPELVENPQMIQGSLEGSNIDMMKSMVRMTTNLRAFEATEKALKIYSDMDGKAAELGSIQ